MVNLLVAKVIVSLLSQMTKENVVLTGVVEEIAYTNVNVVRTFSTFFE